MRGRWGDSALPLGGGVEKKHQVGNTLGNKRGRAKKRNEGGAEKEGGNTRLGLPTVCPDKKEKKYES